MPAKECSTCTYWKEGNGYLGFCRFSPPTLNGWLADPGAEDIWEMQPLWLATSFPVTRDDDWCGKWDDKALS